MATPDPIAPGTTPPKSSLIDERDVMDWTQRFNEVLEKPSETLKAKAPEDARPWHANFCGFCLPIDTCLLSFCIPCITFGKTHHRTRKHGGLEGYRPVNTSCFLYFAAACLGVACLPQSLQRSDIRRKYNLQGSCATDIAAACCCPLCDLVQQDKEAEYREGELGSGGVNAAATQYENNQDATMEYGSKA